MQVASLLAVALFAGVATTNAGTTIHAQPFRANAKVNIALSSVLAATIDVKAGGEARRQIEFPGEVKLTCVATVTHADEAGATLAQLVFGPMVRLEKDSFSRPAVAKEPRASNSSYDLTRAGAGFEAKGARGDLDREEREATAAIAAATLSAPPLGALLDGRSPARNERIELSLDVAKRLLPLLDVSVRIEAMTLTFTATRKEGDLDVAVFEVVTKIVNADQADMSVTADLDGELLLDPSNGHVRSLALSGPVEFTGSAKEGGTRIDLAGKGTWKYDYSAKLD